MSTPIASVSVDLDDLWSYQRTHGDPEWKHRASYLPVLVPRLLDLLDECQCRVTVFLVGADAADRKNARWMRLIVERGHEVGNHSFRHECWLHLYPAAELEEELRRAEEAIVDATGQHPSGFRGPGFSWSQTLLELLADRGYHYDASTLPTFIGPLARAYFLATARMTPEQRRKRAQLFGSVADGMRPAGTFRWRLPSGRALLEIPVTTVPVVKIPFHMSYLIYLSRFSPSLMNTYFRGALAACRAMDVTPSFLLHPLDVLGPEDAPQLAFFPGMDVPGDRKRALVREALGTLGRHFSLVPMSIHAAEAARRRPLDLLEPRRPPTVAPDVPRGA